MERLQLWLPVIGKHALEETSSVGVSAFAAEHPLRHPLRRHRAVPAGEAQEEAEGAPDSAKKGAVVLYKKSTKMGLKNKREKKALFYQQQRLHVPVDPPGRVEYGHDRHVVLALIISPGTGLVPDGNPFERIF